MAVTRDYGVGRGGDRIQAPTIACLFAMRPNYVVWSGYELDRQSFVDFVRMLYETPIPPERDIIGVVGYYTRWKDRLPRRERSRAPNIRCMRPSPFSISGSFTFISGRTSDPEGKHITHIFLPMRWMPYKSRRQLEDPDHPDYAAAHEPTEKDEATLQRWLNCVDERIVEERYVKRDVFKFAAMKELHPSVEWRVF